MQIILFIACFFLGLNSAHAVKLFGVELVGADQTELRQVVEKAGAKKIKQAGKFEFYDEYDSSKILDGSSRLYLGFDKKNQKFVFAEYEFLGLDYSKMLFMLSKKYGNPKKIKGKFISDLTYLWQQKGMQIKLTKDWLNYKNRVLYVVPEQLQKHRAYKKQIDAAKVRGDIKKQFDAY